MRGRIGFSWARKDDSHRIPGLPDKYRIEQSGHRTVGQPRANS